MDIVIFAKSWDPTKHKKWSKCVILTTKCWQHVFFGLDLLFVPTFSQKYLLNRPRTAWIAQKCEKTLKNTQKTKSWETRKRHKTWSKRGDFDPKREKKVFFVLFLFCISILSHLAKFGDILSKIDFWPISTWISWFSLSPEIQENTKSDQNVRYWPLNVDKMLFLG